MIWDNDISFEGLDKKVDDWYEGKDFELTGPPINHSMLLI